ncbi:MAG TPA: hypothetical protein VD965_02055 [Burkholderiales bacterium]|nr:hypothetical protein [Burkholderiales bacterium]
MRKLVVTVVAAALSAGVQAQVTAIDPNVQQVQLLAPQLLAFAGSQANFNQLVAGLTQGQPVTLATVDAGGNLQIVTFTPPGNLTPTDAARALENARQNLIARGVATPNAQQIAVALVGGAVNTPAGTTTLAGTLPNLTGSQLVQVRNEFIGVPGGTANASGGATAAATLAQQNLRASLTQAGLTTFEANQALQLASLLLAQNGIINPTQDQLATALNGGTVLLPTGQVVSLAGIVPGRLPARSLEGPAAVQPLNAFTGAPSLPTGTITPSSTPAVTPSSTPTLTGTPLPLTGGPTGLTGTPIGLTAPPVAGPTFTGPAGSTGTTTTTPASGGGTATGPGGVPRPGAR